MPVYKWKRSLSWCVQVFSLTLSLELMGPEVWVQLDFVGGTKTLWGMMYKWVFLNLRGVIRSQQHNLQTCFIAFIKTNLYGGAVCILVMKEMRWLIYYVNSTFNQPQHDSLRVGRKPQLCRHVCCLICGWRVAVGGAVSTTLHRGVWTTVRWERTRESNKLTAHIKLLLYTHKQPLSGPERLFSLEQSHIQHHLWCKPA